METSSLFAVRVVLVTLGLISVLLALVFGFLSSGPVSLESSGNTTVNAAPGLFLKDREYFNIKYPSDIGPASWVFVVIWPIIFLWNMIGACYMFAALFLPRDRSPIKRDPPLIPITALVFWILAWNGSTAWLFTFDREYLGLALFFLIFTAVTSYGFLGFSYRSFIEDTSIIEEHSPKMLWLVRILVHNGFGIYTTWVTCAWKLNFQTVVAYVDSRGIEEFPAQLNGSLTAEDAGTIALCLLLVEIIVWFILENFVFEKYCRYTLSVYPVLIFAFSGILVKNYVYPYSRNQSLTVTGLVFACVGLVARIVLVAIRHRNRKRLA